MTETGAWEPRRRARRRALQALYQWQLTGQETTGIITQFFEEQDFEGVDQALFQALVTGVEAQHDDLAQRLQPHLDRPLAECDVLERVILLMGAWELSNEPATPTAVVLDECVELAKRFGSAQSPVYVNGVLDKAAARWASSTSYG